MKFQDLSYDILGEISNHLSLKDLSCLSQALDNYDVNDNIAVLRSWKFSKTDKYEPDNTHLRGTNRYQGPPGSWVSDTILSNDEFKYMMNKDQKTLVKEVVNATSSPSLKLLFEAARLFQYVPARMIIPKDTTVVLRGDFQVYVPALEELFASMKRMFATEDQLLIKLKVRYDDFEVETSNQKNHEFASIEDKYENVLRVVVVNEGDRLNSVEPIRALVNGPQVTIREYNVRSYEGFRNQSVIDVGDNEVAVKIISPMIIFTTPISFQKKRLVLRANVILGIIYAKDVDVLELIDTEVGPNDFILFKCKTLIMNHCLVYTGAQFRNHFPSYNSSYCWNGNNYKGDGIFYNLIIKDCRYAPPYNRNRRPRFEVSSFYKLPNPYYSAIEAQYTSDDGPL